MRKSRILSILLLTALLFLTLTALSGCFRIQKIDPGDGPSAADPTVSPDAGPAPSVGGDDSPGGAETEPEPVEEPIPVNFTLEMLVEENLIPTLLEWNDTVTVRRGSTTDCFWKRDGDRVMVSETGSGDSVSVAGSYRGFDFYVYPQEPVTAVKWITAEAASYDAWIDGTVSGCFPSALTEDIVITAEDDNNYTVRLVGETELPTGEKTPCTCTAVVNKGTLFAESLQWEYTGAGTQNSGSLEIEYNGGRIYTDVMDEWNSTRTVTIDIRTEAGSRTEAFPFPESWRLQCLPDEGIFLRSADAAEQDGALLVGADTGDVLVNAWDLAFLPAAEPAVSFTLEELVEANTIGKLLGQYDTVTTYLPFDGGESVDCFWMKDGELVNVSEYRTGESVSAAGRWRDFDFYIRPEGTTAIRWISRVAEPREPYVYEAITNYFPAYLTEDIAVEGEDETAYTLSLVSEIVVPDGSMVPCFYTAVVSKETLSVQSLSWEYFTGDTQYYSSLSVEYNGERLRSDALAEWDNTRTVTFDIRTEAGNRTEEFPFPEGWQLQCVPGEGILFRSSDTGEQDGTLLVDANTGNVTVTAWDEATLAASETQSGTQIEGVPFTLEELCERNSLKALTKEFGSVILENSIDDGTETTSFYLRGDEIVHIDERTRVLDGENTHIASGEIRGYHFGYDSYGHQYMYVPTPKAGDPEYPLAAGNNAVKFYENDFYLTSSLHSGAEGTISLFEEGLTFYAILFEPSYEGGEKNYVEYVVNKETLCINTIIYGYDGKIVNVTLGGEVGFAKVLEEAFAETRNILVHYEGIGDLHYEAPAKWTFSIGGYLGVTPEYWADKEMQTPLDDIPADGKDYEFWASDRKMDFEYMP